MTETINQIPWEVIIEEIAKQGKWDEQIRRMEEKGACLNPFNVLHSQQFNFTIPSINTSRVII